MKQKLLVSFCCTLVMFLVMRWQGAVLVSPQSPLGIIDFELARTPGRLRELLFFWNLDDVLHHIYLDFLFIAAYGWFLYTACSATGNSRAPVFSGMALSAAAFDVLENLLMMLVITGRFSAALLQVIFFCAVLKFLLLALVLLFLLVSLVALLLAKSRG